MQSLMDHCRNLQPVKNSFCKTYLFVCNGVTNVRLLQNLHCVVDWLQDLLCSFFLSSFCLMCLLPACLLVCSALQPVFRLFHLTVSLFVWLPDSLSVRMYCMSVCLSVYLSACLSACLPVCLSTCLPVCLPVCLSACPPACPSVCLFVRLEKPDENTEITT